MIRNYLPDNRFAHSGKWETYLPDHYQRHAVGRTLGLEDGPSIETFLITGVAKNLPANSSLKFQAVIPFKFMQRWWNDGDWLNYYLSTFVLLHPSTNLFWETLNFLAGHWSYSPRA